MMKQIQAALTALAASEPSLRSTLLPLLRQAGKWEKMPKGWTAESRKKFWETLTGNHKHKVTQCIKKMEGKMDDPGAFCASLADRVMGPGWRKKKKASQPRVARADVNPVRQRTQYSCMSASMTMCLRALGHEVTEDEVNRVMGARPMKGAAWEQALACAQHYGCRATLTMPSTVDQMKVWTDAGIPIMIAWNPEGRDWSHASVVYHVDDDLKVWVADPNIPNPKETTRIVTEDDFYSKWYEKFPDYLVRRPACAIEREITEQGLQIPPRTKLSAYSGNPDGKPLYDVEVDHGESQALSGGHDIMKRLVDRYRVEQGHVPREPNPRLSRWNDNNNPKTGSRTCRSRTKGDN